MNGEGLAAYGLEGFPFGYAVAILFVIVLLRAQGTYWLGRGIAAGSAKSGIARKLDGSRLDRATGVLRRYGPIAVPLSFLTIGFQTMINLSAGIIRMPWHIYTLAMIPGCVAWAFVYATIGLAAFLSIIGAAAGSPWGVAGIIAILALAAVIVWRHRRRRGERQLDEERTPAV